MLAFGLAFGMISANAANTPIPMMNTVGLSNLGSVQSTPSLFSINNMAASLLTQSKFSATRSQSDEAFKQQLCKFFLLSIVIYHMEMLSQNLSKQKKLYHFLCQNQFFLVKKVLIEY